MKRLFFLLAIGMPGLLAAKARAEGNKGLYILQPAFGKAGGSIDGGGI